MEKVSKGAEPATTFVRTDASTFKELVQRLTGPHDECLHASPASQWSNPSRTPAQLPSPPRITGVRKPAFKLHERRHGSRSKLTILRPHSLGFSTSSGILSPSPCYTLSPLMSPSCSLLSELLIGETESSLSLDLNQEEEEKAIRDRRFYLHPSPRLRSRNSEPQLLPLFPLTSPK